MFAVVQRFIVLSCIRWRRSTILSITVRRFCDAACKRPMIPEWFASTYPHLAAALMAMKLMGPDTPSSSRTAEPLVALELADANKGGATLSGVLTGLFEAPPIPNEEFVRFSLAAYREFGVSED